VTRTLLVDGNSLLNTGFHGIKNMYNGDDHIGGLYHFLNTLRKHIDLYLLNKVVVFWDGKNNTHPRTQLYPHYKLNRKTKVKSPESIQSYNKQKIRVQEYLEELYVRQASYDLCEADDCIAYYCKESQDKEIIVLTSDRDLLQVISPKVSVHILSLNKQFRYGDKVPLNGILIPHTNVRLVKTICGDSSDNIKGIKMVGIKSLSKIEPKILKEEVKLETLLKVIRDKDKLTKKEENILKGTTNSDISGPEILDINFEIIGAGEKFLTIEAQTNIIELSHEAIDPEGRHWKHALNLMMSDGILNILPKRDDAWVEFIKPFLRLSRIEKDFYKYKT